MNGSEKRQRLLYGINGMLLLLTGIAIIFLSLEKPKTLQIPPNHYAIFAYGSLINKSSLEKTLGRTYDLPFIQAEIKGWKRSWSVRYPNDRFYYEDSGRFVYPENIVYLNLERNEESIVNGVIIIVSEEELKAIDKREAVYDRVAITRHLSDDVLLEGTLYTYIAKPEYFTKNLRNATETAIRKEYITIVEEGVKALGDDFSEAFQGNSADIPEHIIVDAQQDSESYASVTKPASLIRISTGS